VLGLAVYRLVRVFEARRAAEEESCICIGEVEALAGAPQPASVLAASGVVLPEVSVATVAECDERYGGKMVGVKSQSALDAAHFVSAGSVCFARGLNDTPKIVALLLVIKALGLEWGMICVALGMAVGGLLSARRVAETMSKKITPLTRPQGLSANLVTAALVIFASRWGMPVSTTHVACGSLFGIGLITKQANARVVTEILLSWVVTLPVAMILGGAAYYALTLS
jgi:PiT family inorganic phosphate transporter